MGTLKELEDRVLRLENQAIAAAEAGAAQAADAGDQEKFSNDFFFDKPGRWLDVAVASDGGSASRNFSPPAGWSGQIEVAAGRLEGNLTDRIKFEVTGVGGKVYFADTDWRNLDGANERISVDGPATVHVTSELRAHISLQCNHQ